MEPARKTPAPERSLTHLPYFHGPLYERMSEDFHLADMAKRRPEGSLRAVRTLAGFCRRTPDQLSEDLLRKYFLHQKHDRHFASGSLCIWTSEVGRVIHSEWPATYDFPSKRLDKAIPYGVYDITNDALPVSGRLLARSQTSPPHPTSRFVRPRRH